MKRLKGCAGEHWKAGRRYLGLGTQTHSPVYTTWLSSSINSSSIRLHPNCTSEHTMDIPRFLAHSIPLLKACFNYYSSMVQEMKPK
jgi:hypothetical protein